MRVVDKLTNKLMSRNYGDFMQSNAIKEHENFNGKINLNDNIPDEDLKSLNDFM